MKNKILSLLLAVAATCGINARAQLLQQTVYMTVTNTPGIGETNQLNGTLLTWTNVVGSGTNFVVIGTTLASSAANLYSAVTNLGLAGTSINTGHPVSSLYIPGSTTFTVTYPISMLITNVVGSFTNSANTNNQPSTSVAISTNALSGIGNGYPVGAVVITNSGATITNAYTALNLVAPTNYFVTPSLTYLQQNYLPGASFFIQTVSGTTNLAALQAGSGTGIEPPVIVGQNTGTNAFALGTGYTYTTALTSWTWTNGVGFTLTWFGGTNLVGH